MRSRKKNTKANKKNLILRVCVFAFAAYAAIALVEMQVEIGESRKVLTEMKQTVESQRIENKELARQLSNGLDEEQIIRIAREKLDYVYPDEKVFMDISGS